MCAGSAPSAPFGTSGAVMARGGTRPAATLVVTLLPVALLGACGGSPEPVDEPPAPLEAYLEEIWGAWDPDAPDPTRTEAEELVAACMAEAGFEYEPVTQMPSYVWVSPVLPVTVEVAEEYGYGITIEAGGPGSGTEQWQTAPQPTAAEPANRDYVDSLSPAARAEYESALNGDPGAVPEEGADVDVADLGCQRRGYYEVAAAHTPPEFTDLRDEMDQVLLGVEEDPRVLDAQRPWGSCMAEAGYPGLGTLEDARTLVRSSVARFVADTAGRIDRTLGDTEYDAVEASVPDELAALQAEEIAVAVADARCREDSGYNRTHQDVTDEYEQSFVDAHREELDAWVAAVRERADGQPTG